jgi:Ca2+-binding EF-hand superfamily protein
MMVIINSSVMSIVTQSERKTVANFLNELAEIERKMEFKRENIAEQKLISAETLFCSVSKDGSIISPVDLQNICSKHSVKLTNRESDSLANLFDHDNDTWVKRADFYKAILAKEMTALDSKATFGNSTLLAELALIKLLEEELQGIHNLDSLRKDLRIIGLSTLRSLFEALDIKEKGHLDLNDIYEFLNSIGTGTTYTICNRILSRLDRDGDKKISWSEWSGGLTKEAFCPANPFEQLGDNPTASKTEVSGTFAYTHSPGANDKDRISYISPYTNNHPDYYQRTQTPTYRVQPVYSPSKAVKEDVVTVIDVSPGRSEKRSYITLRDEFGNVVGEDKVVEPLYDNHLAREQRIYTEKSSSHYSPEKRRFEETYSRASWARRKTWAIHEALRTTSSWSRKR